MSVRLWPVLPKDNDRNGLGAIERALIEDPEREHIVVAVINQRRTTTDADSGETTPAARVVHIEAISGDSEEAARNLLAEAHTERTGHEQLPFDDGDPDNDDDV